MIKTLKLVMWLICLGFTFLGFVMVLKAGKAAPSIYAGLVIVTLALNRPSFSLHAIETSYPVFLMQWLWRQATGRICVRKNGEKPLTAAL